ncbi:MAG: GntR family transcriptional regulator [Actinomycetota bacterium]|nr:GntR family transcriptional regulator [Actinomycetota bacterium]
MPSAPPSAQVVYDTTKAQILSGELAGGSLLSEAEVARRLNVSRTPAREAFVRLEAEGFLSLLPRRGAVVTPLTPGDMVDLLEVREGLEVAAVRRLGRHAGRAALLAAARAELEDQQSHAEVLDLVGFSVSDQRFHLAIVRAAGNALATRLYGTLGDRQRQMTAGAVQSDIGRLAELLRDHRGLLDLAEDGDAATFSAALRRHFESTHKVLLGA